MNFISKNLLKFKEVLKPFSSELIAVSKTYPSEILKEAYDAGQILFGENKVQEMVQKYEDLPKDIKWHLIGHLQTNKVKYIAPFVHLIHAVDSMKLLQEINKEALKNNRVISCLLQIYIANEDTKFGMSFSEATELFQNDNFKMLNNIKIEGLMGMATNTNNQDQIRSEFKSLKKFSEEMKAQIHLSNVELVHLSMGMSGDYQIALEEGSTMIRVGSAIFGNRNYEQ